MPLITGSKLGPYEILSPVGAGGMGEVYRARDTRLERTVAVKVLNSHLVATSDLRARFEREAKVISQLQHPHICTLHDVGSANGTDFLVMEYLEGESLAERLIKGPLPTADLLKIAIQVADALDKAHRAGIIHRDLKPSNVMLTKSGAKLLDFGLAKPLGAAIDNGGEASRSVLTSALTMSGGAPSPAAALSSPGLVLGTIQYMAPEQVQGLATDVRSDIFSFGVMLFEMATGKRAFTGKTPASIVGQILAVDPPPVSTVQPGLPPVLERTIQICLAKDPEERFQSAHDLKLQLQTIAGLSVVGAAPAAARSRLGVIAWLVTTGMIAVLAIIAAIYFAGIAAQPKPVLHAALLPPDKVSFRTQVGVPELSPDGTKLAFMGADDKGATMLYVRHLNSSDVQALAGTEGAHFPFWSPDSQSIGFFADKRLKRIDAAGGLAQDLAEAPSGRGGTWSSKGVILYRAGPDGLLKEVPTGGGALSTVSKLQAGEDGHIWPSFLPDGNHYLFKCESRGPAVCLGDLGSRTHKVILTQAGPAIYANGYVLFMRGQTLLAQPFNLSKLALSGDAVPLTENVALNSGYGTANFSASNTGVLVYQGGEYTAAWPLTWYGRDGKPQGNLGEPGRYSRPEISPDGNRVVVTEITSGGGRDVWIFDMARGTHTRFTFDGTAGGGTWTGEGREIVYSANGALFIKPSDNSAREEQLAKIETGSISASADGRYLAFMHRGEGTEWDIWGLALQGDHKPFPVVETPAAEVLPALSPDSKLLAYCSSESGSTQLYVTTFPTASAKWQVTTAGGCEPRWRGDGKELFFADGNDGVMSVDVATTGNSVALGTPHLLFRAPMQISGPLGPFDVMRDGKKFLVNSTSTQDRGDALTIVTNWTAELKK